MFRFSLLVSSLSLLIALVPTSANATIGVSFAPSLEVKENIQREISQTSSSIDVAMYSFSDRSLLDSLKQAAMRGTRVRLVLNKADNSRAKSEDLEEAGIDVRFLTITMHHKFAIFDGPLSSSIDASTSTLLTGSGNWSGSSSAIYDEDQLIFKNEPEMVKTFQSEFNFLWVNAREFGKAFNYTAEPLVFALPTVQFTTSNMAPFTNSNGDPSLRSIVDWQEGVAGRTIVEAIDSAEDVIRIATAHYRRSDIDQALQNALRRGVKIEMVLDQQEFHPNESLAIASSTNLDEALALMGAKVRYKRYSRKWDYRKAKQMHAKYIIIDDMLVLTGSFNWSRNSETNVTENLITLTEEDVAISYFEHFQTVFNYGNGKFDELRKSIIAAEGTGPCYFESISLNGLQIKQLDSLYVVDACQ